MPRVELNDDLYERARQRAADTGHASVDSYVTEMVSLNLREADDDFDHRFTPEMIADLEQISAEMEAGKTCTEAEIDEHLKQTREQWLRNHPQ